MRFLAGDQDVVEMTSALIDGDFLSIVQHDWNHATRLVWSLFSNSQKRWIHRPSVKRAVHWFPPTKHNNHKHTDKKIEKKTFENMWKRMTSTTGNTFRWWPTIRHIHHISVYYRVSSTTHGHADLTKSREKNGPCPERNLCRPVDELSSRPRIFRWLIWIHHHSGGIE